MLLDQFCVALRNLPNLYIPPLGELDLEDDDVSIHVVIIDIIVLQVDFLGTVRQPEDSQGS